MSKQELELQVHDAIIRILDGGIEDDWEECKSEWPGTQPKKGDTKKDAFRRVARQLAAHANAARWKPITWIVGVDEGGREIVGANQNEFSNWWNQVKAHFVDRVAPSPTVVSVREQDKNVIGIVFETDRAPYLVKTGQTGGVTSEAPWREGNSTRSAGRYDLLKVLVPRSKQPDVMLTAASLTRQRTKQGWQWRGSLALYIVPRTQEQITFPDHTMEIRCAFDGGEFEDVTRRWRLRVGKNQPFIHGYSGQVTLEVAAQVSLQGSFLDPSGDKSVAPEPAQIDLQVSISEARSMDIPAGTFQLVFEPDPQSPSGSYNLVAPSLPISG